MLLFLPQVCAWTLFGPTGDDAAAAFAPAMRIPLASLVEGATSVFSFEVPHTSQWERIRRAWGDPGYVVLGSLNPAPVGHIVPYHSLNLAIQVAAEGKEVRLQPATSHPFLYSSDSFDYGLMFQASPGQDITVRVKALAPPASSSGELVVRPYWTPEAAGHIFFASDVEDDIRPWATALGFCGAALIGIAIGRGRSSSPAAQPLSADGARCDHERRG